jgi:hypothetical protein
MREYVPIIKYRIWPIFNGPGQSRKGDRIVLEQIGRGAKNSESTIADIAPPWM